MIIIDLLTGFYSNWQGIIDSNIFALCIDYFPLNVISTVNFILMIQQNYN